MFMILNARCDLIWLDVVYLSALNNYGVYEVFISESINTFLMCWISVFYLKAVVRNLDIVTFCNGMFSEIFSK